MNKKKILKGLIFGSIALLSGIAVLLTGNIGKKTYYPIEGDDRTQILFLGDSNIANEVEEQTIPHLISKMLDVNVYNCAVGGTTAAKANTDNHFDGVLDLFCLYNLSKALETQDHNVFFDFYVEGNTLERNAMETMQMMGSIDCEKIDYVVISYGLNDYVGGFSIESEDPYDEETYTGALRCAVERIIKQCPNAKIIFSSITYCVFEDEQGNPIDGYEKDWGGGNIEQYRDAMGLVANEYENVYFMDNLKDMDIHEENFSEYMRDAMHFSVKGQEMYAQNLTTLIEQIERDSMADE